jgi:flavin-dependent dehydrogenase
MYADPSLAADVLVVGAGSAGAGVAAGLARRGYRVLVVDRREVGTTGARWVNAVPAWCFDEAGLARPSGRELWKHGGTFFMVAPGGGATVAHDGRDAMAHVDMRHLVERLVGEASRAGARFVAGRVASVDLDASGRVASAELETPQGRPLGVVRPRLVVDASGMGGAVRERVPSLRSACARVEGDDLCVAAQYQYRVGDPDGLRALLARHGAAPGDDLAFPGTCGGYSTLTLFTRRELDEVGVLAGSIPSTRSAPGHAMLEHFLEGAPWLGERLFGGQGPIPVRRPYDTLGGGGVALVGDSACQVFASHGSGVGMGLIAGRVLADAAEGAADPGHDDVLRAYERAFRRRYGGLLAASDAFRRFSQRLDPSTAGELLRAGLVDDTAFSQALTQRPHRPSASSLGRLAASASRAPALALRMAPIALRTVLVDRMGGLHARGRMGVALGELVDRLAGSRRGAPTPQFVHPETTPPSTRRDDA